MKTTFTQRKFYIIYLILVIAIFFSRKSFAADINDYGSNATYNLNAGDSLTIVSGTYTGNINKFFAGAKITVMPGANFSPSAFKNPAGAFTNYGTSVLSSAVPVNAGFTLKNSGSITFQSTVSFTGTGIFINIKGGTVTFQQLFTLSNGSSLQNDGVMIFEKNFNTVVPSIVVNNNTIKTYAILNIDDVFTNNGMINAVSKFNINAAGNFINNCRVVSAGGVNNFSANTINNGLVWATATTSGGGNNDLIQNNGTWYNSTNGKVRTNRFINNSTFAGDGYVYITDDSQNNGPAGDNSSSNNMFVYDITRSNPATIFDAEAVTPAGNVVYQSFAAPDTNSFTGCAPSYITQNGGSLPIKLSYFSARAENNTRAILNWVTEAEIDNEYFTIERSQDNKNYNPIGMVMGAVTTSLQQKYEYKDNLQGVDMGKVVYYRIKQTDIDGKSTYSPVRTVKFNQKQNIIQVNPNPIVDNITVKYMSDVSGSMDIRIINTNGQITVSKKSSMVKGYNNVAIYNLGSLAKGLYVVEVVLNGEVSEKTKLMKH
jgi:Secretion system C-terminal sorting domain